MDPRTIQQMGIIPAYAGSTEPIAYDDFVPGDHPRIRGEHWTAGGGGDPGPGSSPHTRGALDLDPATGAPVGIIPAYAGSTDNALHSIPPPGIIPAYAGSTFVIMRRLIYQWDHPRIRGEHEEARTEAARVAAGIIPAYAGSTLALD